jgi:HK97 family phage major capsid protein
MSLFANYGEFLSAVMTAKTTGTFDRRLSASAGINSSIDTEGGFLIPEEFASPIFERLYSTGQILARVNRLPPPVGNTVNIPTIHENSRADGSRFGGAVARWVREGDPITSSKIGVGCVKHKLNKVSVLIYATAELFDDVPALVNLVQTAGNLELVHTIEKAVFSGTGAGQPLGLLNAPAKITVAAEENQTAQTITAGNIRSMARRLWGPCHANAVWLANESVVPQILALAPGLYDTASRTLAGWPVLFSEHSRALGTEGDLILTDLSAYSMADKSTFAVSAHIEFVSDQYAYRLTVRVDGAPTWSGPLTPDNGDATLSPIITLSDRLPSE